LWSVGDTYVFNRRVKEGPCEYDLYLACAKFVTTKAYAPRLRARRQREMELIGDAEVHNWGREVERHRCIVCSASTNSLPHSANR
jgi:hypothetical protein